MDKNPDYGRIDMENMQPPPPSDVPPLALPATTRPIAESLLPLAPEAVPQLSDLAKVWDAKCQDCGGEYPASCCIGQQKYDNNCAHFLSDALIRAGFTELLTDPKMYKCDKSNCKCKNERRPIRAKEMRDWFDKKTRATGRLPRTDLPASGWWAVFQLDTKPGGYPGGHVIVLNADANEYYGTCAYWDWSQIFYQW